MDRFLSAVGASGPDDRAEIAELIADLERRIPDVPTGPAGHASDDELRWLKRQTEGDGRGLSTTEAARRLSMSRPKLAQLIKDGEIESWRTGTHHRLAPEVVEDYRVKHKLPYRGA